MKKYSLMEFGLAEEKSDPREFTEKGSIESGLAGSQDIRKELNSDRWECTHVDMRGHDD